MVKMMERFDCIRTKHFKNQDWIEEPECHFYLNSVGKDFTRLDLRNISDMLGVDVTSYSFR